MTVSRIFAAASLAALLAAPASAEVSRFQTSNFDDFLTSGDFERIQYTTEAVDGYNVNFVSHPAGGFVQSESNPGQWTEVSAFGDATFTFNEVGRDEWSVYLYDPSRNVSLQLDLHRRKVVYGEGSQATHDLYDIDGASAQYYQTY